MKTTKNIARLAVTAGLTAALSFGGVMAPVTMAFAEGKPTVAENGSVTIREDTYKDTTFKGIKIFSAKVTQAKDGEVWSGDKTLSDIEWTNESVMNAVTAAYGADESKPDGFPTGQTLNLLRHGPSSSISTGLTLWTITSMPEACSTRSLLPLRRPTFPKALTVG